MNKYELAYWLFLSLGALILTGVLFVAFEWLVVRYRLRFLFWLYGMIARSSLPRHPMSDMRDLSHGGRRR